ncbi:MAG: hypothetical protein R2755_33390 [Acidimicrobiales bacterium]
MHIGSQVFVAQSFARAMEAIAGFVKQAALPELNVGGGLGVAYVEREESEPISAWGERVHARAGRWASRPPSPPNRVGPSPPRPPSPSTGRARSRTSPACAPTWPSTAA